MRRRREPRLRGPPARAASRAPAPRRRPHDGPRRDARPHRARRPGAAGGLVITAALAIPVIALSMIPALQFDEWMWLAFALGVARRGVGRLAVPPRHVGEPAARRHHDGHADQHRRARRLRVVGVRAVLGRGRGDRHDDGDGRHRRRHRRALPRGGRRGDDVPRRRALPRGQGQAPLGRRPRRAPVPRRQGRRDPRRRRASGAHRSTSCARACGSSSGRASRSPPTASSRRAPPRSTRRCSPASRCPVEVGPGDAVTGATINAGGRLVVRATRVGADTALARIARLVEEAQSGKADVQRLADRISAIFVPIVLVLAAGTLAAWLAHRPRRHRRVHRRGRGADHRLPVRARAGDADGAAGRHRPRRPARRAHPRARRCSSATQDVDTIVLDKTGTVTTGRMALVDVTVAANGVDRAEALRARRRARGGQRAPDRSRHRRRGGRARRTAARRRVVRQPAGPRRGGRRSRATGVVAGRAALLADSGVILPRALAQARADGGGRRPHRDRRAAWDGAGHRRVRGRRRGEAHQRGGGGVAARARPATGAAHRRQPRHRAHRGGGGRHRPRRAGRGHRRRAARGQGRGGPRAPGRGPRRRHGRRRRERRRRPRPGRPRARDGHRHRRRHRGERPHPRARRPARPPSTRSACRAARSAPSRGTSSGPSPTTWPPCPSPPSGSSAR